MVSQTTVENYCLPSHTSSGRKHKGSEGGLLNLSDTVTILTFLLCLVTSIQRGDTGVAVARCIRMKHPYVKKGTLPLPPESPSMYVCPSLILTVGSLRCNDLPSKWCKGGSIQGPHHDMSWKATLQ